MFSVPFVTGREAEYLTDVIGTDHWHGDGRYTARATALLRDLTGAERLLLTTSCTHALELAALLLELGPGDEVICPAFTFTSTASAIAIRGATPVFVDIDPVTLNLAPEAVEAAVTARTKAVFVVHYAGVGADLDRLVPLCRRLGLALVEDTAHGLDARYRGRPLGTFGEFGTLSFHDTKNVAMGEGGALLINDASYADRAEVIREKGTNRSAFLRGAVDKYSWVDQGSSYLPSEILAAVLTAQLEGLPLIQARRHHVWDRYHAELASWAEASGVRRMVVPEHVEHPAHMYYLLMPRAADQTGLIRHLKAAGITATFHYQPLDSAPAGVRLGRTPAPCRVVHDIATRLVRLPLHANLDDADVDRVLEAVASYAPGSAG